MNTGSERLAAWRRAHGNAPSLHAASASLALGLLLWLTWLLPVPPALGRPGLWSALLAVAMVGFYLRVSKPVALCAFVSLAAWLALAHALAARDRLPGALIGVALVAVALNWAAMAASEPRRWPRLEDLLLGPAWLADRALTKLNRER